MARTTLTAAVVPADVTVLEDVAVAADLANGNAIPWGARSRLFVANGDATDLTVTLQTPATVGPQALAVADATVTVPAGKSVLLRPLGTEFRRADGQVWLDYAGAAASVTAAVLDES